MILIRKSGRLPPKIIWITLPAAVSEGVLRFARPGPCQMNRDSPKWDLKVPRTQEILHFAFFVFLDSGGECVYFPRRENKVRLLGQNRLRTLRVLQQNKNHQRHSGHRPSFEHLFVGLQRFCRFYGFSTFLLLSSGFLVVRVRK